MKLIHTEEQLDYLQWTIIWQKQSINQHVSGAGLPFIGFVPNILFRVPQQHIFGPQGYLDHAFVEVFVSTNVHISENSSMKLQLLE